MHQAVLDDSIEAVQAVLQWAPDLSVTDKKGLKPVDLAYSLQREAILLELYARKVFPTKLGPTRNNPLHVACELGDQFALKLLIKHKPYHDAINSNGHSPLDVALLNERETFINPLISAGCDWRRNLLKAASNGDSRTVGLVLQYALAHGAIDADLGNTWDSALGGDHVVVCEALLVAGLEITSTDADGAPLFWRTVASSAVEVTRLLISKNAAIQVSFQNKTPLQLALQNENVEIAEILLGAGALSTRLRKKDALFEIAQNGSLKMARLLVREGCDSELNARREDQTPVDKAIESSNWAVAQFLIEKGSTDINLGAAYANAKATNNTKLERLLSSFIKTNSSKAGEYAMVALERKDTETALIWAKDGDPQSMFDMAVMRRACQIGIIGVEFAKQMISHGIAKSAIDLQRTSITTATEDGYSTVVDLLLRVFPDLSTYQNSDLNTLLHIAVNRGHISTVGVLIDHCVPVGNQNGNGETALHLAARQGFSVVAQYLLDKGAEVNAVNDKLETPLHIAVLGEKADLVGILLRYGADAEAKTIDGSSPLHHACTLWNSKILRALVDN
jgi:ankyrin repeat protein